MFKQATIGDCNIEKPSLFEFVARAKYDAWNSFKGLGFRDARNLYIESVETLQVGWSRQGEYEYIPSPEEIKVIELIYLYVCRKRLRYKFICRMGMD